MEEVVNMGKPHSPDWVAVGMRRACESKRMTRNRNQNVSFIIYINVILPKINFYKLL